MGSVAAVVLMNEQNKLLLYLRDNKPSIDYPDNWALLGGHVEGNETPTEALKRELREEIGHELVNPIFLGCFDDRVGNVCYMYKDKINKKLGEIVLTEGQRLGYFTFEEALRKKIPAPLRDFFMEYKERLFME
ncbi:MAG: NUDIX domain-containing protein [Candidatus Pacearchaeota archaeon]|nr:NUDIX domain-containing protein [Candidatus Pacearchaeota archaeon]